MGNSLRERAARLLIVRLGSNMIPSRPAAADADGVANMLDQLPVGGVILFNGAWPAVRDTLAHLQSRSAAGLLVGTDMERGVGQQVRGATLAPHLAAFGRLAEVKGMKVTEDTVRTFARQSAAEALACGINLAFAPVADVDRNPRNPIIGARTFGADPERVARLVTAYVEGARAGGLLTTAKHFPGHGGTAEDSHATLPVVTDDRDTLQATDLVPFRAAIEAGVDLVMTSHVAVPGLDPSRVPATRSRLMLTDLLRGEMGFQGAVITDSLHMAAIHDERGEGATAAACLAAGVDLFCDPRDPLAVVEGIVGAVASGDVPERRLDEAVERVEALRARLRERAGDAAFVGGHASAEVVGHKLHADLSQRVARGAVHLVRGSTPDLGTGEGVAVIVTRPVRRSDDPDSLPLVGEIRARLPNATVMEIHPHSAQVRVQRAREAIREAKQVLTITVARPAAWHAFGLQEREQRLAEQTVQTPGAVLAVLGDARGLEGMESVETALLTYSDVPVSQQALIDYLTGEMG